jgi:hypothetical protein
MKNLIKIFDIEVDILLSVESKTVAVWTFTSIP